MKRAASLLAAALLTLGGTSFAVRASDGAEATAVEKPSAPDMQLVMFEQQACSYCQRWEEEVGVAYPLTSEGQKAPLRRVNIHADWPEDLKDYRGVQFTPTFVLLSGGQEIGRMPGYLGEDFFWGYLDNFIRGAEAAQAEGDDAPLQN